MSPQISNRFEDFSRALTRVRGYVGEAASTKRTSAVVNRLSSARDEISHFSLSHDLQKGGDGWYLVESLQEEVSKARQKLNGKQGPSAGRY